MQLRAGSRRSASRALCSIRREAESSCTTSLRDNHSSCGVVFIDGVCGVGPIDFADPRENSQHPGGANAQSTRHRVVENRLPQVLERDYSMARASHVPATASQRVVTQVNVQTEIERTLDQAARIAEQRESSRGRETRRSSTAGVERVRGSLRCTASAALRCPRESCGRARARSTMSARGSRRGDRISSSRSSARRRGARARLDVPTARACTCLWRRRLRLRLSSDRANAAEASGGRRLVPEDTRPQRNVRSRSTRCANERTAARAMSLWSLRVVRTAETCTARARPRRLRRTPGKASVFATRSSQVAGWTRRPTSRDDELAAGGDGDGERGLSGSGSSTGCRRGVGQRLAGSAASFAVDSAFGSLSAITSAGDGLPEVRASSNANALKRLCDSAAGFSGDSTSTGFSALEPVAAERFASQDL